LFLLLQSSKPDLDLLSDTQSEDGLFAIPKPTPAPKQSKTSVLPPESHKLKLATTDDLFTASVDNEIVGGKPAEGGPDVVTEAPKPQKKKPAGVISMFGVVDLFGGGGGGKNAQPDDTTVVPSMEKKQETVTSTAPTESKKSFGGNYTGWALVVLAP